MKRHNDDQINFKLTQAEKSIIKEYCLKKDLTMSQAIRRAILKQCKES